MEEERVIRWFVDVETHGSEYPEWIKQMAVDLIHIGYASHIRQLLPYEVAFLRRMVDKYYWLWKKTVVSKCGRVVQVESDLHLQCTCYIGALLMLAVVYNYH